TAADHLRAVDVDRAAEIATAQVAGAGPALLLADGRIAVASRADDRVVVFALGADDALRAVASWPTGPEPTALAVTPNDATLLVGSERTLEAHDLATGACTRTFPLADAPSAIAAEDDRAPVAHGAASAVTVIDLGTG